MDEIVNLIKSWRYAFVDEEGLQDGIAKALEQAGLEFRKEYHLGDAGRIDFYLPVLKLGIEVKSGKSGGGPSKVLKQLIGYADHPDVAGLILVTTRASSRNIPGTLRGKPVQVAFIWAGL